jgi:hypothetical protein
VGGVASGLLKEGTMRLFFNLFSNTWKDPRRGERAVRPNGLETYRAVSRSEDCILLKSETRNNELFNIQEFIK